MADEMFKDELAQAQYLRAGSVVLTHSGKTVCAHDYVEAAETIEKLVTALQILRAEDAARAKQPTPPSCAEIDAAFVWLGHMLTTECAPATPQEARKRIRVALEAAATARAKQPQNG